MFSAFLGLVFGSSATNSFEQVKFSQKNFKISKYYIVVNMDPKISYDSTSLLPEFIRAIQSAASECLGPKFNGMTADRKMMEAINDIFRIKFKGDDEITKLEFVNCTLTSDCFDGFHFDENIKSIQFTYCNCLFHLMELIGSLHSNLKSLWIVLNEKMFINQANKSNEEISPIGYPVFNDLTVFFDSEGPYRFYKKKLGKYFLGKIYLIEGE